MNARGPSPTAAAWHTLSVADVASRLGSGRDGLSHAEIVRRQQQYGPNEIQGAEGTSAWAILAEQLKNILIVILLIAAVLSIFLGHGLEAAAIIVIVVFAVLLGFVQEYRAEQAIAALRRMAAPAATVLRDGNEHSVPARELVPGDLILLHAGDRVPADLRLSEVVNLRADEASLTGESLPVEKHTDPLADPGLAPGDRTNQVFAGTAVTYGRGRGIVTAIGMDTEFGRIAGMLGTVEAGRTPLQKNLDRVGHRLAQASLAVVAVIVALGLLRGQPLIEMIIFGVALAVAVVPEALPAVVTISLAIGVQQMLRRHALIRRLPVVETLGTTSVICSDKTGTLTRDEMTARKLFAAGQTWEISGAGYEPSGEFSRDGVPTPLSSPARHLLQCAVLASDVRLERRADNADRWEIKGDPTEAALVVAAAKAGLSKSDLDARHPRVHEIPFTSERKYMVTVQGSGQDATACAKGAPEVILALCSRQMREGGETALDEAARRAVLEIARAMADEALRVLAVATRTEASPDNAERDMTFLGLVGMIDPPRPEAFAAIQTCARAGIKVVMITGDHPGTARAVAAELGVLKAGRVVTGADLEAMSDADLGRAVDEIEVYARVSPAHKLRVVQALQANGHVAAMTGDGVNDAPALKQADVGVAMGITGTDVSKEAAAMTLTDDNFASIVAAVEVGRGIFSNIKKYLMYLLSSNIGEIGLMAGASLLGLPLPLSAVQILYINLATDGLPALALAVDPPESDLMQRRPRGAKGGIFTRPVVSLMVVGGVWSSLVNLGLFVTAMSAGYGHAHAMTLTFVSLALIQFVKAYNFRSDRNSVFCRPFANRWLNAAVGWELLLLGAVVYTPFLQQPFKTFSLTLVDWGIVSLLAISVSPVLEAAKWMVRHGWLGATTD